MRFRFDEKKTAQAAAFLINRHGGQLNYMVLLKLLYMADRRALIERGVPITGDKMLSMPHGTALSRVLNLLRGMERSDTWSQYVSPATEYDVRFGGNENADELSRYELNVLIEIDEDIGDKSWREMRTFTHELPEYQDPGGSSLDIRPETVLHKAGVSNEDIISLDEESKSFEALLSAIGR